MIKTSGGELISIPINSYEDVVIARQQVRTKMEEMGYTLIDQSMTVAAVSELARNIVIHAGRGTMSASCEERGTKRGITCVFEDAGPGIDDLEKILQKKSGAGMSVELGLSGSRNLSDEFSVKSSIGKGTTVSITKWLRIVPLH